MSEIKVIQIRQQKIKPYLTFLGISILNVVPLPISECLTYILPLWYASTIRLVSDKPKPQPRRLVL